MIKAQLQENFTKDERAKIEGDEIIEDVWKENTTPNASSKKKLDMVDEGIKVDSDSSDEEDMLQEANENIRPGNKKKKQLNKGSLLPSGTHLSWKD